MGFKLVRHVMGLYVHRISKEVREASLKTIAKLSEEVNRVHSRAARCSFGGCNRRSLVTVAQAKQRVRSIRKDAVDAFKDAKGTR